MAYDKFLIAPIGTGLERDMEPWMIPDDAFSTLTNAYVWRGRVRKRFGSSLLVGATVPSSGTAQLFSRLRIQVGTIAAPVSPVPGIKFNIGQQFSAGGQIFTVWQNGAPAAMLATGPGTGTFDTTNGNFALAGTGLAGATPIYWYPAEPVMGFANYQFGTINTLPTFAYDTQFAYQWTGSAWARLGTAVWTGSNSQFFWSENYHGITDDTVFLFTTNFKTNGTPDPIRYWDGAAWNNFQPQYGPSANDIILTARIILSYKGRLLLFNTFEQINGAPVTSEPFVNRCRFSAVGDPTAANAWRVDIPGNGNFIDAYTKEQIVTAQIIKDRVIVFFENSTWELVYTNNQLFPFLWQQINVELGAESTFSVVPFDKALLTVGNVGIHACNGANVERIDKKIPDEVFEIHNQNDGVFRVAGIRDFTTEMVYWTFPTADRTDVSAVFPNNVLVYNYATGSWAFNVDSFTAFGYLNQTVNHTWENTDLEWQEYNAQWDGGPNQSNFRDIVAGNQEGFTCIIDPDTNRNAPSLQITNMTFSGNLLTVTAINHNLSIIDTSSNTSYYVVIENAQGMNNVNDRIFPVNTVPTADTFTILILDNLPTGTYTGGGTVALVSNINILTKQFNPYIDQAQNVFLAKVDFCVTKTTHGEILVDYFTSSAELSTVIEAAATASITGNNILETRPYLDVPFEQLQNRLWHTVYFQSVGECIQLRFFMTLVQITDPNIAWSDFVLQGMILYTQPSGRLQ